MMDDTLPPAAAIDWDTIDEEILCPLCDYNLRGLIEPRCPECGSRYTWDDLFDPRRRAHPYLFEHHPKRNWWSFWRTVTGGLRPTAFWETLHPVQRSNGRRLLAFALLILGGMIACLLVAAYVREMGFHLRYTRLQWDWNPTLWTRPLVRAWASLIGTLRVRNYAPVILVVAWPFLSWLSLLIFQASMRRAKIKVAHVMRCAVYSADALLWFGFAFVILEGARALSMMNTRWALLAAYLVMAAAVVSIHASRSTRPKSPGLRRLLRICYVLLLAWPALVLEGAYVSLIRSTLVGDYLGRSLLISPLAPACLGWMMYKLVVAYRIYLQFDRPLVTVFASQLIVALIVGNAYLAFALW